jgi:hypothetical protein
MVNALFENGRNNYLTGALNWTSDTVSGALLDLTQSTASCKQISGATNATPIAITATSHGFTNGDIVYISGVGGNLAANGLWLVAGATTNAFNITDLAGNNVVGSGTYTSSTGRAVNMGSSISNNWSELSGCLVGSKTNLSGESAASGVANASTLTFTSVSGNACQAIALFKDTGTASTSKLIALISGDFIVTCSKTTSSSATSLPVDPLKYGIPTATVLTFSNGNAVTLSGAAAAGDRALSVSSTAATITAGNVALAPQTSSGLPVTPNGNNIVVTWDTGSNKIFKL